jgi:hypothetical protein
MEINNQETFFKIIEIFYSNRENFDLEFSFVGTGVAKIKKLNANFLEKPQNIISRKYTGLNIIRKIIRSIKS